MATASTSSTAAPRRSWYRLHFSTWLVAALGLIFAVLLIVPGGQDTYPDRYFINSKPAISHGWPATYLWRVPPSAQGVVSPWRLVGDSAQEFHPLLLGFDIAVASIAIVVSAGFWEFRRRRRRPFQISLRTVLIATTFAAIALGWWRRQYEAHHELSSHLQAVRNAQRSYYDAPALEPRFPFWLRSLVGDEPLLAVGLNRPTGGAIQWSPSIHDDVKYLIERYPELFEVGLSADCEWRAADPFFKLQRLQNLQLDANVSFTETDQIIERACSAFNLRRVEILVGAVTDKGLACLGKLPSLQTIRVDDTHRMTERGLEQFFMMTNLESIRLFRARISAKSIGRIAAMPGLRQLVLSDSMITDADLIPIGRNAHIRTLHFALSLITDDGLRQLHCRSLTFLNLGYTAVTDAGIAAFKLEHPDVTVFYDSEAPDLADLKTKIDDVKAGRRTYFAIGGWKIQDRHLSELGELTGIESLALNARHLTDATLARVESLKRLKELDVSSSLITGRGLRHVVKLPQLRSLTLDEGQIDDEAIRAIKELPAPMDIWIKHELNGEELKRLEVRLNAALPATKGIKLHLDARSNSGAPWD